MAQVIPLFGAKPEINPVNSVAAPEPAKEPAPAEPAPAQPTEPAPAPPQ